MALLDNAGALGSIGSTFLGDLATIQAGAATEGQFKANAKGARRAAGFTERIGALEVVRQGRETVKQQGGIRADASGAGLTQGGSSADILAQGARDSALDTALLKTANQEAVTTFLDRASGFDAQAKAAKKKKKKGGILGAIGGVIGGIGGFIVGGPAGAAAGASLGSGLGNLAGSL